jgi:hypothetical protein
MGDHDPARGDSGGVPGVCGLRLRAVAVLSSGADTHLEEIRRAHKLLDDEGVPGETSIQIIGQPEPTLIGRPPLTLRINAALASARADALRELLVAAGERGRLALFETVLDSCVEITERIWEDVADLGSGDRLLINVAELRAHLSSLRAGRSAPRNPDQ